MTVATRELTLQTDSGAVVVPAKILAPERDKNEWICRFEIDWPDGKVEQWGTGEDSAQALLHAMQMIGALLYASRYHETGQLSWLKPGDGYGFPVTNNMRDLLVGADKRSL